MPHLPPELWARVRQGLGMHDLLESSRVCRAWRRHALRACRDRWPHPAPPPWAGGADLLALWRRVLDPRPCCLICGDTREPTSVVVLCPCLRRAAGAVTVLRFHHRCWDCQCLRPECSVVLVSCPLCGATRVGWRRFLLE